MEKSPELGSFSDDLEGFGYVYFYSFLWRKGCVFIDFQGAADVVEALVDYFAKKVFFGEEEMVDKSV